MQIYNAFLKVARTRVTSILIYYVVFLIFVILSSQNTADDNRSRFEASSVPICIIDEDKSAASHALTEYLLSMHESVVLDSYEPETLLDNLYYGRIGYVLSIPEGFERALLAGQTKDLVTTSKMPDSTNGIFIDRQIDLYLRALSASVSSGASVPEAVSIVNTAVTQSPDVHTVSFEGQSAGEDSFMYYYFQYLSYVLLVMLLEGLSPVLIRFRQKDLRSRIACSSMKPFVQKVQLGLGCMTYSLAIWLSFILPSFLIFGAQQILSKNGLLCLINSAVFTLVATALTLFIGTFSIPGHALNMISNIIGLGMGFLCGVFVPQQFLGDTVLSASRFLPAYWYVRITNMLGGLSEEAFSIDTYRLCIGIELLFFFALFAMYLASSRFHRRSPD